MTGESRRVTEEEAMPRRMLFALAVPVALLAGACAETNPLTNPSPAPAVEGSGRATATGLVGPVWKLTSYEAQGAAPVTALVPDDFTSRFTDGRVEVRADCNRCGGGYSATESTLSVGLMACTLAACPSAPLDTQFAGALQAAQTYTVTGSRLVVVSERARLTFTR
jgi:heat shock protein HslJ